MSGARFYLARSLHGAVEVLLSSMDLKDIRPVTWGCSCSTFARRSPMYALTRSVPNTLLFTAPKKTNAPTECIIIAVTNGLHPVLYLVAYLSPHATTTFVTYSGKGLNHSTLRYLCEGLSHTPEYSNYDPNTPNESCKDAGDRRGVKCSGTGAQQFGTGTRSDSVRPSN